MKILAIGTLVILMAAPLAAAQTPDYYLIYGNRDGSTIDVNLNLDIGIKVWISTPANGDLNNDGIPDSIGVMHNPLATNDSLITSRDYGSFEYILQLMDEAVFFDPNPDTQPGYTNQSLFIFSDLGGPPNPGINSGGDTMHIATYFMHTTTDSIYLNQTVFPFSEGFHPGNGNLIWGLHGDITAVIPLQTFSPLYFVDYLAGDANGSGFVNGLDVTYLVYFLKGYGPPPDPILSGDANGDCIANGIDVSYIINYCKGGPGPFLGNCH